MLMIWRPEKKFYKSYKEGGGDIYEYFPEDYNYDY